MSLTEAVAHIAQARTDVRNAGLACDVPPHVADNTDTILAAVEHGLQEHQNGGAT